MSNNSNNTETTDELPTLWTHEPHSELMFRPGEKVSDIDTGATPGFKGDKADAAAKMQRVVAVDPTSPEAAQARTVMEQLK